MAIRSVPRIFAATILLALSGGAAAAEPADAVLQWNEIAQQTVAAANPLVQARSMAITQLAVLDALRAAQAAGAPPSSFDAAVIAAAHDALVGLQPDAAAGVDAALATGLAKIAEGEPKKQGIAIGQTTAADLLAQRKGDGSDAKIDYDPTAGAGVWVPTPPKFMPAFGVQWGSVAPFVLKTGDQFRPEAPAALDSTRYRADLHEVLEMGAAASSARPPAMTDVAKFWVISAVQGWNPAARQASLARKQTLLENARTFSLLNLAMNDALIACFDAKYTYKRWRPVTAIRAGIGDIKATADWLPLIVTPPHPSYPSAHACAAGAAQAVLERSFGADGHALMLTSSAAPGVTFEYASFAEIADQIDDARVYGGIHTRQDQEAGRALGQKVGRYVWETLAQTMQ